MKSTLIQLFDITRLLILASLFCRSNAFFSVNYLPGNENVVIANNLGYFREAPSAEVVADICARITGNSPVIYEGKVLICVLFRL